MTEARLFTVRFVVGLVLLLASSSLISWVVDPYGVFGRADWPGVNTPKVERLERNRCSRAYGLAQGRYKGVILGSSRAWRCNPQHPAFGGRPVYNASLPAATVYEMKRYLQHAQGAGPLLLAVVGLDYFSFASPTRVRSGFAENRLLLDQDGRPTPVWSRLLDYGNIVLSVESLKDSWATISLKRVFAPQPPDPAPMGEPNGRGSETTNQGARSGTLRFEVDGIMDSFMSMQGYWLGVGRERYQRGDFGFLRTSMEDFEGLLDFAYRHEIEVAMYLSPLHVRLQAAARLVGIEAAWIEWKRLLVKTNEAVARRFGRPPFPVWDFATVNERTTEALPDPPNVTTQWYEDLSHFSSTYADQILAQILGRPAGTPMRSGGFGVDLRSENLETHLVNCRDALDHWMATHPEAVRSIAARARALGTLAGSADTVVVPGGGKDEP